MRNRTVLRRYTDRAPFLVPNNRVFRLPSMAPAVRLLRIVEAANDAQRARASGTPDAVARETARMVAAWGVILGATWHATDLDLDTPDVSGPWSDLDTGDPRTWEPWGDSVVAELQGAGWSLALVGEVYSDLAVALVRLCTVPDAEVKARADFSDAPMDAPNG
jgi:hypothetical protein